MRREEFDLVLDECIDRIVRQGETAEDCLARYPEYAQELEAHLLLAARTAHAYSFAPNQEAKTRGRQRLQSELQALQQRTSDQPGGWPTWSWGLLGLGPRWATAVGAVLLALTLGGASTVAASSSALPGDPLYTVKRTTEEVRLALELSAEGKAKRHLTYAERRAEEITRLVEMGVPDKLDQLQADLNENLKGASTIASGIKDKGALADIKSHMERGASLSLGRLQDALAESPAPSRQRAGASFQDVSRSYGDALERVSTQGSRPSVPQGSGVLQVVTIGAKLPRVDRAFIEVESIEAHLAMGDKSRWEMVGQGPMTLDLLSLAEASQFLAEGSVPPGTYTKVRLLIGRAVVVTSGVEHPVKIPSERLSITRPFRVEEGKTTILVLDFDLAESLRITGNGEYIMEPVIRVLTDGASPGGRTSGERDGVERPTERERGRDGRRDGPSPEKSPSPSIGLRTEIEGVIEAMAADSIVVKGKRISITPTTRVDGLLEVGREVKAEVVAQADGTFVAERIKVEKEAENPRGERGIAVTPTAVAPGAVATPTPSGQGSQGRENQQRGRESQGGAEGDSPGGPDRGGQGQGGRDDSGRSGQSPRPRDATRPERVEFVGQIQRLEVDSIVVNGETVLLTSETEIDGVLAMGVTVKLEGLRGANGTISASKIEVQDDRRGQSRGQGESSRSDSRRQRGSPPDR